MPNRTLALSEHEKTNKIIDLLNIDQSVRDADWTKSFLENIGEAHMVAAEPQVITGPDGFPYLVLDTPSAKVSQFLKVKDLIPAQLLEAGIGIAIHPERENPDWIFTYGDLVNYFLQGEFYTESNNWIRSQEDFLNNSDELLLSQPSEYILPVATRDVLRAFFAGQGLNGVKIILINRPRGDEFLQQIIFNLTPDMFRNEEHFNSVMGWVAWFLPRHYSYGSIEEKAFGEHFLAL